MKRMTPSSYCSTTRPSTTSTTNAFGVPRVQGSNRSQWLGGKERSTELRSGVVAMGARTCVPQLGRFLQTDPVVGGSANDYDYVNQDPIDGYDLDGNRCWSPKCALKSLKKLGKAVIAPFKTADGRRALLETGAGIGAVVVGAATFSLCAVAGGEVDLAAHCILGPGAVVGVGAGLFGDGVHNLAKQHRKRRHR